jgi:quinol-cytochrome oxidoreductase complex cytochrome b subunit
MNITRKLQQMVTDNFTMEDALPTRMPIYVNSVAYLWGVCIICSIGLLFISGPILAFFGPEWYHYNAAGRFINSVHFWSTQVLFLSMFLHLATKFFMGAWRGDRRVTWMLGVVTFIIAVPTALTGYLSQTNWDSQWIAVQAKDALNATGVGSFLNTLNTGQMLTVHTAVLPIIVLILGVIHVILVRREGPVEPL